MGVFIIIVGAFSFLVLAENDNDDDEEEEEEEEEKLYKGYSIHLNGLSQYTVDANSYRSTRDG